MNLTWTTEQILALAPDDASAKAGRALATPGKWVSLGRDARAVWGECKGSGSSPYQVQIDLPEPAFKCTCPSRKFPCKHGIGLFLIFAADAKAVAETAAPAWVTDWLDKREKTAQKKQESGTESLKTEAQLAKAAEDQAKRAAGRQAKVTQGLIDLDRWLCDLIRQGLSTLPSRPYSFWDEPAARLVDAQAPGVARMLRDMAGIPLASGEDWTDRMLERLGLLHLLLEGYSQLDTGALTAANEADIRAAIGWNMRQEDVLAQPGFSDYWLTTGQRAYEEEQFRVVRTWLQGLRTGKTALLLEFTRQGQPPQHAFLPGAGFEAELAYYPGAYPQRALVKEVHSSLTPAPALLGYPTIAAMLVAYANALAANPWLELFSASLIGVIPIVQGERRALRDTNGSLLWLNKRYAHPWRLMALSGGHPITIMGEWDGISLFPLSVYAEGRYLAL